jgi:3-deoxy-7-phosphoheptulonate synthase
MGELKGFFAACHHEGIAPAGVHLELTHEDVTECLGGAEQVEDHQLRERYQALCDPRLNARQSLDLAFELAEMLQT